MRATFARTSGKGDFYPQPPCSQRSFCSDTARVVPHDKTNLFPLKSLPYHRFPVLSVSARQFSFRSADVASEEPKEGYVKANYGSYQFCILMHNDKRLFTAVYVPDGPIAKMPFFHGTHTLTTSVPIAKTNIANASG